MALYLFLNTGGLVQSVSLLVRSHTDRLLAGSHQFGQSVSHFSQFTCTGQNTAVQFKVESLLETLGTSPGDVGDVRGPWRRWRRSATFVGDVPDLATFGDVRWRPSERTSPASVLKESNGGNVWPLASLSGRQHTARTSPGDVRSNVSSQILETFRSRRTSPGNVR